MSTRFVSLNAAITAACLLVAPGWAMAHGGLGGMHIGGGHFGGGHFGGGHFGGGHFGGGRFGGGHHFGGGGGGWGGGGRFHGGSIGGGSIGGGFRGGGLGGGGAGGAVGGAMRGGGGGSNFGASKLGGAVRTHMSGGTLGHHAGGTVAHHAGGGAGGMVRGQHVASSPNSFVTRHVSSFAKGTRGGAQGTSGPAHAGGASGLAHAHHVGGGAGGQHPTGGTASGSNQWGQWGQWSQFGYPRGALAWGIVSTILNNLYFGYGYGGYGYGYGYGSYGGGYGYNPNCYYGAYGLGGYASPGYYLYTAAGNAVAGNAPAVPAAVTTDSSGTVAQQPATGGNSTTSGTAAGYADDAEAAFKAGDFKGAEYALRHAVVDDPHNPVLVMMLSQALFANGKYDESAGAAQNAMQQLPKDQWGVVVTNYQDLYNGNQAFTDQLRALEKAAKDKPDTPAIQFLLGFEYGYLGYPKEAIEKLDKTIKLAPRDEMAKQLREEMRAKLSKSSEAGKTPAGKT